MVHRFPERRITQLVPEHLENCRALRINVAAEEQLEWLVDPFVVHNGATRPTVGLNALFVRAKSIEGAFVDSLVLLAKDLLHARRESFVQPRFFPTPGR